jgi:protein TonB
MSVAATFGRSSVDQSPSAQRLHGDNKRWAVSFAFVLALHVVAAVFILRWYQNLPTPMPQQPTLTMIELAPLPSPPAPPVASPPPPPPEPQVQPLEEPVPVAKPIVQPKPRPVIKHVERPQPQPQPTQTVESVSPTAAPPTPMPPAQPSASVQAIPSFSALIAAQLEHYKRYPDLAKRRGEQGIVKLRFTLNRSGGVSNAQIEHGSGYADLDNEVLALVQRAQPLPAIPADIPDNTLDIHVPVSFSLH